MFFFSAESFTFFQYILLVIGITTGAAVTGAAVTCAAVTGITTDAAVTGAAATGITAGAAVTVDSSRKQ